jgi:hypothetical protein
MPLDSNIERKLDLTLRGLHVLIRMGSAPADKARQLEHYMKLQNDIGPWLTDYVTVMSSDSR